MKSKSGGSSIARKLAMVATVLGLWGALVLLFAAPLALTSSISWRQTIGFGISFWALWLLFMPLVAWLSFRFPMEGKNLVRNLSLHLLACLLVVVANRFAFRVVEQLALTPPRSVSTSQSPGRPRIGPPAALGVFLGLRAGLDVLVYWALIGACHAIMHFQRSQNRERRAAELEASLISARLQALRMQINPHFLFNTLNSIATLIYVNPRAADEMIGDLSELLRRALDSMEEQEVPLRQELQFVQTYLNIEQKRFGERLRVEQRIPDELLNALVPAFILQPLIENAIRHGIEPQRGPGLISIVARREGDQLHLIIRDNGRGFASGETSSPPSGAGLNVTEKPDQPSQPDQHPVTVSSTPDATSREGIGLTNTCARLQGLYGPSQSFSVTGVEPQGCQVIIRIPFHLNPIPSSTTSTS